MAKSKLSFAKQFAELEEITRWFERDDVDLEEGIAKFERGMQLAKELKERLRTAEVKIEEVRKKFA
jgi:exodeoxyribonuclease VII small subunit